MKTIKLEFSPLLKLNNSAQFEVDKDFVGQENISNDWDGKCPGIYIWGFLDPNNAKTNFIPYYVGDSASSILGRIATNSNSHLNDIYKETSTYRRLTTDYFLGINMVPFYSDEFYPVFLYNSKQEDSWLKSLQKDITKKIYYVKKTFFFEQIGKKNIAGTTLGDLPKHYLNSDFFLNKKQFRFMYLDILKVPEIKNIWDKRRSLKIDEREFLEIFEGLVKFSLNGKTSSGSINDVKMKERRDSHFSHFNNFSGVPDFIVKANHRNKNLDYLFNGKSMNEIDLETYKKALSTYNFPTK